MPETNPVPSSDSDLPLKVWTVEFRNASDRAVVARTLEEAIALATKGSPVHPWRAELCEALEGCVLVLPPTERSPADCFIDGDHNRRAKIQMLSTEADGSGPRKVVTYLVTEEGRKESVWIPAARITLA